MSKQKQIFLDSEGDAWFRRNKSGVDKRSMESDPLFDILQRVLPEKTQQADASSWKILEIGCSSGNRILNIQSYFGVSVAGVEPSAEAVEEARRLGLDVKRSTADQLPFENKSFDLVIFGFCLYLCDVDELFKIASEAHRVLKDSAWLLINDFFSQGLVQRDYAHRPGVKSSKMDYSRMFSWHPAYEVYHHQLLGHVGQEFIDDPQEWMAITLLRKFVDQRT